MIIKFKLFENNNILPIGSTVRVLPKLEDFIKKHNLSRSWYRTIGKILTIESYYPNHPECKEDIYVLNSVNPVNRFGFLVPVDCVEPADTKSVASEFDPYGEEDWNDDIFTYYESVDLDPYNEETWDEKVDYSQEQGVCFNCGSLDVYYEDETIIKDNYEICEYVCYECGEKGQERWILTEGDWDSYPQEIEFLINEKRMKKDGKII